MNLPNEIVLWGLSVVAYEALAAIAAGVAVITLLLACFVTSDNDKKTATRSWDMSWISMSGILFAVPVILGLHLEQPLRSITIFLKGNLTSPMPYGVLILTAWVITALYGLAGLKKDSLTDQKKKKLSIIASVLGLAFVTYLGFLLSVMNGMTLWNSALKPIQYVIGTIGVGSAVVLVAYMLLASVKEEKIIKSLMQWMTAGLAANMLVKGIAGLYGAYIAKTPGMSDVGLSFTYYGLEWIIGLALPLILLLLNRKAQPGSGMIYLSSSAVIIGAFAEKFNIIIGGQLISRNGMILAQEAGHLWNEALPALGGIALVFFFLSALVFFIPVQTDKTASILNPDAKNISQ